MSYLRKITVAIGLLSVVVCPARAADAKMDTFINDLMGKMTLEEKIGQLNLTAAYGAVTGEKKSSSIPDKIKEGKVGAVLNATSAGIIRNLQDLAVKESRLHIPLFFGLDVIHGHKTTFPIPLAMSCTWDLALIERTARIAAQEATASGINWTYSPMVDIARDPRWGRIAESSGEDPWLGSQIARVMVKGYQGDDLAAGNTMLACVKHFAFYGASEAGRDYNSVDLSRMAMYNYYLPPYKAAVEAGTGSVMSSFNLVDEVPATGNKWLLTDLLRTQWGFKGLVVTDYTAINEMTAHGMGDQQTVAALALSAGTDMDMVGEAFLNTLQKSVAEGKVSEEMINTACRRILEAKYKLGLFQDPYKYLSEERLKSDILTPDNLKATREAAVRSMVLLKNEGQILPLKKKGRIALIGPLIDRKGDMLGAWATPVSAKNQIVTIVQGMKNVGGADVEIVTAQGASFTDNPKLAKLVAGNLPSEADLAVMMKEAVTVAEKSDVVVAVLGEPALWSGEAHSRADISLPAPQQNLLKALLATGKPVVLVLINGRPLTLPWEAANVGAILEAWAGGTEMGNAVADVIFGDYNPAGKLTATFPVSVGQIPLYYNHKNTGRPANPKDMYTSRYTDVENEPVYPFGYGLSYTTFEYGAIKLSGNKLKGDEKLTITVPVRNAGKSAGEEVVQLYIQDPAASISRPVKELKNFRKIMLQPGETRDVVMDITTDELKFYNSRFVYDWEPGEFIVYVGTNSRDVSSAKVEWTR